MSAATHLPLRLDSADGNPAKRREFALRHANRILLLVQAAEASIAQLAGTELSRSEMLEVLGMIAEEADLARDELDSGGMADLDQGDDAASVAVQPLRMADFTAGPAVLCAIARRYAARVSLVAEGAEASLAEFNGSALPHQDMLDLLGMLGEEADSMMDALLNAEVRRARGQGGAA